MSIKGHLNDLDEQVALGEQILGRPIVDFEDWIPIREWFLSRSKQVGLSDDALDARISMRMAQAAMWKRLGGARVILSDSVVASFVLTKSPPGDLRLPLPALAVQIPKGFMPSSVDGEYEGLIILLQREEGVYASAYIERGEDSSTKDVWFSLSADEETRPQVNEPNINRGTDLPPIYVPAERGRNVGQMIIRMARNLVSWMEAFPTSEQSSKSRSAPTSQVGESVRRGELIYLRTLVSMSKEMRCAARSLVNASATMATKKLAIRHIVRGHWKRQACGVGGSDRKTVYVAPYWRGPDGPAAWGRVYKLDEPTIH